MIHQDLSVLSIMSQHLWRKKHNLNEVKSKQLPGLRSNSHAVDFLPHIVVVRLSQAPSCDENRGTAWGRRNRKINTPRYTSQRSHST